jgi:hypothetical protein
VAVIFFLSLLLFAFVWLRLLPYIWLSTPIFLSSCLFFYVGSMDRFWPALTQSDVVQELGDFLGEHVLLDMAELLADSTRGVGLFFWRR